MKSRKALSKFAPLFGSAWTALFASGAFAQEAGKSSSGLEEIIVTTQRRAENVQETPIAITAITAENLEKLGIFEARDLSRQVPSFMYREDSAIPGYASFTIRGISQAGFSAQPSVGLNIDGVYATVTPGSVLTAGLFDVERVEVLKGSQGTLFGRNTIGGAINVTTQLPTGKYEGKILAAAGSHGRRELTGVLNLPIAGDDVGFRLVAQGLGLDGYGENLTTNTTLNGYTQHAVRGTFRARMDRLEIIARGQYSDSDGSGIGPHLTVLTPNTLLPFSLIPRQGALELGFASSAAGLTPAILEQTYQYLLAANPSNPRDVRSPAGFTSWARSHNSTQDLTATFDLTDTLQLKSITAYRKDAFSISYDDYGIPVTGIQLAPVEQDYKQTSQELQLNGSLLDERIKFATGAYYYDSEVFRRYYGIVAPLVNPGSPVRSNHTETDKNYAGYGQATVTILPNLNATVGIRYTDEEITSYNRSRRGTPVFCKVPAPLRDPSEDCLGIFPTSFTNTSWTAGLDYKVSTDLMVYGKVSTGFKAGGLNDGVANNVLTWGSFPPETVKTYEAGLKSELFDRRLRANLAVYQSDYTDIQRASNFFDPATGASGGRTSNAASARVRGVELELTAAPTDNLELNGGVAYTDAGYTRYIIPGTTVGAPPIDHTNDPFQNSPEWQASSSIAYTVPVSFGSVRFQADGTYQSATALDPGNINPLSFGAGLQEAYALFNARVTVNLDDKGLEATAYMANISDKLYRIGAIDSTNSFGAAWANYGPPRMWGVRLTQKF